MCSLVGKIQTKLLPRATLIQLSNVRLHVNYFEVYTEIATTSKSKRESRDLRNDRITTRDYIVCYEHRNCNRFLISCGEVFQWSQSSSMLRRQFPADVGVTNRQPSSNSELIFRMEMRLLACLTRGSSREPYQTY